MARPRRDVRACRLVATGACIAAASLAACSGGDSGPAEAPPVFFEGARLILGDGNVLEDGSFLVRGGRIAVIGRADAVDPPPGVEVVELAGKTVIPALIDAHAHLGYEGYTEWGADAYTRENLLDNLDHYAYYGFGAVFSAGTDPNDLALEVQREQAAGDVGGARLLFGAGVAPPGQGPNDQFLVHALALAERTGQTVLRGAATPEEGRAAVRDIAAKGIHWVKIWVDDRGGSQEKLSPEIYRAIIDEAHAHDLEVVVHQERAEDMPDLLDAGVTGFLHGRLGPALDERLARRIHDAGAFLVPNLGLGELRRERIADDPFLTDALPREVVTRLGESYDARTKGGAAPCQVRRGGAGAQRVVPEAPGRRRGHRPRHRRGRRARPLLRLRGPPRAGDLRAARDDAGAGDRRRDQPAGRATPPHRHGHAERGQERRLRGPRRQPARGHPQHENDLEGVPERSRDRPRRAPAPLDRRRLRPAPSMPLPATPSPRKNMTDGVPRPPHPRKRKEPLPSESPRRPEDDPAADARVRALIASSSYVEADHDVDFLAGDDTRGVRLQLDYLKTEHNLRAHDVEHTVVVFGSTRIPEPRAAERAVRELEEAHAERPDSELERRLGVARRMLDKSHYYEVAREFGRLVGRAERACERGRLVIATGGGPGIMEAANRGAFDVEARSVGLNIHLPREQYPNPYITQELCFQFHYFAIRKLHFMQRARALVAFPGGYGTLDELFETLALVQTRTMEPVPIVLVGEEYWRRAVDVDFLVDEGVIDVEDRDLFWYAETATEIWDGILRWHELAGAPLVRS